MVRLQRKRIKVALVTFFVPQAPVFWRRQFPKASAQLVTFVSVSILSHMDLIRAIDKSHQCVLALRRFCVMTSPLIILFSTEQSLHNRIQFYRDRCSYHDVCLRSEANQSVCRF
ncbi:hypothetical protein B5X24_HaOG215841 [Helicoverpa armigera]|nr:hypothetical protein B5X24_HaOG215841 [Helicoverpa armigera]